MGAALRDAALGARAEGADLSERRGEGPADTVYTLDRVADDELLGWFEQHWVGAVEVVAESLADPVVVGRGEPEWTCIVDPVDGTRGLMYDKRPAWSLAAAAPAGGPRSLRGLTVAAMTEIPLTKQAEADQYSGVRREGVEGERVDLRTGARRRLRPRPSRAADLEHGFASFARFFPQGKALVAEFEERLWADLYGHGDRHDVAIFDDQYIATGGQFAELLAGHDRLLGDVRPLAFAQLGMPAALASHPYDCCTALLLEEAGCVVTDPWGDPLDGPLDTTSPVAWVGYANVALAENVGPRIHALVAEVFPAAR